MSEFTFNGPPPVSERTEKGFVLTRFIAAVRSAGGEWGQLDCGTPAQARSKQSYIARVTKTQDIEAKARGSVLYARVRP